MPDPLPSFAAVVAAWLTNLPALAAGGPATAGLGELARAHPDAATIAGEFALQLLERGLTLSACEHPDDRGGICLTLRNEDRAAQEAMANKLHSLGYPEGARRLLGQPTYQADQAALVPAQSRGQLLFTG